MRMKGGYVLFVCRASLSLGGCSVEERGVKDLANAPFVEEQSEIRDAVLAIKADIELSNIEGLQAAHLIHRQSGAQLRNHFLGQDIALLHIDSVLLDEARNRRARRQHAEDDGGAREFREGHVLVGAW